MGKHITLSHLQTLLPPIKHLIDKKAENVDWNENDPNAAGYVRNKPFYEYTYNAVIVDETLTTFTSSAENLGTEESPMATASFSRIFYLTAGESYVIKFNDQIYNLVAKTTPWDEDTYIGNPVFIGESETEEPFMIITSADGEYSDLATFGEGNFHVVVEGKTTEIKKIDEKFLPPQQEIELGQGNGIGAQGVADYSEIFNDYLNNKALGGYAHAEGSQTTASNHYSHAEGYRTEANGISSHSEGESTYANGDYSHTEGFINRAIGEASHAEGRNNYATGDYSHAEGYWSEATGRYSHSEGANTFAFGEGSHSEGIGAEGLNYGTSFQITGEANSLIYTIYANDISYNFTNFGITVDKKACAMVLSQKYTGYDPTANKYGYEVTLDKTLSTTENYELARVYRFTAGAIGWSSHTEGRDTIANSSFQHVQGKWNIVDIENKYAHIVGNGAAGIARSNAHTLDWSGNAWYQGDVYVGGSGQDDENAEKLVKKSELDAAIANLGDGGNTSGVLNQLVMADSVTGVHYTLYIANGEIMIKNEVVE